MPADQSAGDVKTARLRRYFTDISHGKRSIRHKNDGKLFLEAICSLESPADCVEELVASPSGLQALKQSLRVDLSSDFINNTSAALLTYVSNDSIRQLGNGKLLREVLETVVEPPLFWKAIQRSYNEKELSASGTHAFACLLSDLLVSSPSQWENLDIATVAEAALGTSGGLLDSQSPDTRMIAYKIQDGLRSRKKVGAQHAGSHFKPGGRHDNDFEDFRKIAIFPTRDEFLATEQPFYLPSEVVLRTSPDDRVAAHLDNQFRLLREDMLAELRNDISKKPKNRNGKRASLRLKNLVFQGISCGDSAKPKPAVVALQCREGLPKLAGLDQAKRKKHYDNSKMLLKHQSFGCLLHKGDVVAFATIDRDTNRLAEDPPVILLSVFGSPAFEKALITLKTANARDLEFAQVDTPFFAYEPVLKRLQELPLLPLSDPLLGIGENAASATSAVALESLATCVREEEGSSIGGILHLPKDVILDHSQTESLATGLTQTLSLIQGPPGTGKSFLGAILAKALLENTGENILVLCYTNHALDQFLEDILDIGVPEQNMLRLGSKSTDRTQSLGLYEQSYNHRRTRQSGALLGKYLDETHEAAQEVQKIASDYSKLKMSGKDLLEYLQFSESDSGFFYALTIPDDTDDSTQDLSWSKVDEKGQPVISSYLISRWLKGQDAGVFASNVENQYRIVWEMDKAKRDVLYQRWTQDFYSERAAILCQSLDEYTSRYSRLTDLKNEKNTEIMRSKRIIGCTTTAAAKYSELLSNAAPGIVIVEEAGEILESHVLTALSPDTKQMILIGDHEQLRPKVNNFALTIQQGDGYDLNRSLFERLVIGGYPHTTLAKQHRMRPEISTLVKKLTYPDLEDDAKTRNRPQLRGFQSSVVFFNHDHPETSIQNVPDTRDENSKISRENLFEVEMVLKTVRYLAQQGYGTEEQVVLTPYLGQLALLLKHLKADHDPILNDLDSFELVKAGLLPQMSANVARRPLRISTIDNFQGEEKDVVIVSLTRGNDKGDIGFMAEAQRVNVLLSRARDGLIIIGNAETFEKSRKGRSVWRPLLEHLAEAGQIYDGLPVRCERHPHKIALVKNVDEFDVKCPDGGCSEPCPTILNCGKHTCPQRCHLLVDHSKMQCKQIMEDVCPQNHKITWECWEKSGTCATCEHEIRKREAQRKRDHELERQRRAQEQAYALKLSELEDEIKHELRLQNEHMNQLNRDRVLEQRRKDLEKAQATTQNVINKKDTSEPSPMVPPASPIQDAQQNNTTSPPPDEPKNIGSSQDSTVVLSEARKEWEYQKACENAENEYLDALMEMIGLEAVKQQFLTIKAKIDTSIRQGVDLKSERFGAVLLGNPGTGKFRAPAFVTQLTKEGKTTIARLYAKFLASVGVLSGMTVKETTAGRLMADGVKGCEKLIDEVLNSGGGAIFIDEAYQLASKNNPGGAQILDFLLPEVENLTGKIVFILAGYRKQMESFFAYNPGLPSRFPNEIRFEDYDDSELLRILGYQINKQFKGRMGIEDGIEGLYCRIAARRVGYGRGREGFGNARAIENRFSQMCSRQAVRLTRERRDGKKPDDMVLTKVDIIGPEPAKVLEKNKAWEKLQELVGLGTVKQSVQMLLETIQYNYQRELEEQPILKFNLNKVFLGSPGTGKTTVAKLYGQILADIGFLSSGEVVVKNPADFVSDVIGGSEKTTQGILASTVGKVLVIDEAYALYGGHSQRSGSYWSSADAFKTAVIDTIVSEVQSVPGDDRCVLLLGYKDQMEAMFQNVNPGLSRRFPLADAFKFEDFSDDELETIFRNKVQQDGYDATDQAYRVGMDVLNRARNRPNFGNGGEVDILLNTAKGRHQNRLKKGKSKAKGMATLEAVDIDPEFDRGDRAATNVPKLFEDVIGCDEIVAQFVGIQKTVANMKARDMDPRGQIPFNILFRGPPGTGKTTTARKMGKLYYDMGFLAAAEVIEASATDLIGEYIGQTGPKTQKLLEKGLGRVLLIDEAYRLAEGLFAKEAMDELVDCLTKPMFHQRMIVILAGYDADINKLMSKNPGLTSRFPDALTFRGLNPDECLSLFASRLQKKNIDVTDLQSSSSVFGQDLMERFDMLSKTANWANGRDVRYLAKAVFGRMVLDADPNAGALCLDVVVVLRILDSMIAERKAREQDATGGATGPSQPTRTAPPCSGQSNSSRSNAGGAKGRETDKSTDPSSTGTQQPSSETQPSQPTYPDPDNQVVRDSGVEDEVWDNLERDKEAEKRREQEHHREFTSKQAALEAENAQKTRDEDDANEKQLQQQKLVERSAVEKDDARRQFEQELLQREVSRRQREEEIERLRKEREFRDQERKKEQAVQRKLRDLGRCVQGFRWIKQSSGYRCAGGSHYISDVELERL